MSAVPDEAARVAPTPEEVGAHMFAADRASQGLGMRIVALGAGSARLEMAVRDDMLNGHEICHGGFITTLADSAFAFACNSRNELTVAAGLTVDFLAPVRRGELLTAEASEVSRAGRTGVYDIVVTNRAGARVALVRGRSARLGDRTVMPAPIGEEKR
jgi:acyl-CoA thioesterase